MKNGFFMNNVKVYNKLNFDNLCKENGWNDNNIPTDIAFISICCTDDCIRGYLMERDPDADDEHWFKENHENVINLNFDDIIQDEMQSNGFTYRCITKEQAIELYNFIDNHIKLSHNFIIHCRAGKSRSQGVARFIYDCYPNYENGNPDNPCLYYNSNVTAKLKRCYNNID